MLNRNSSSPATDADTSDRLNNIDIERIHLLFKQTPLGIFGSLLNAGVLAWLLRNQVHLNSLIIWTGCVFLVAACRIVLFYSYSRVVRQVEQAVRWKNLNIGTLILSGALWGAVSVFLFPAESIPHQFYFTAMLCVIVAGAAMAFSVMISSFLAFAVPALFPLIIRLLTIPDEIHIVMGIMALIFFIWCIFIANNVLQTRMQLLRLKEDLTARIAERTLALEQANEMLKAENQDRIKAEEHLRRERDHLETITANIGAGLAVISRDHKILWSNRVLKKIFGDIGGGICYHMYHKGDEKCAECAAHQVFDQGLDEVVFEQQGKDVQGNTLWSQVIITPIRDTNGYITAVSELVLPITERKKAAQERERMGAQLEEARKLEAVATLAGGIAHQFNNALSVIVGNVELMQYDYGQNAQIRKHIEAISASSIQMSHLTDQLLAYAKGGKYKPRSIGISQFIETVLPILKHSLRKGITLANTCGENLPDVHIDVTQMQMVVTAVLANASEAIVQEGNICIACRQMTINRHDAGMLGDITPGPYVQISVADDGVGMDEKTVQRIFEPFFTTKFQGRGLAMAAVYGIVKNHGGHIKVASQPGQGTQVLIYLPCETEPETSPEAMPVLQSTVPVKGSGTVLLVEDEEMVMEVNRSILERLGYQVIEACTGKAAIDIISRRYYVFDLVLLDIKLPDMDGATIYPVIKKHRPDTKVIICSGYALDGHTQALLDAGADGFIHKPFSLSVISEKIDEIIKAP